MTVTPQIRDGRPADSGGDPVTQHFQGDLAGRHLDRFATDVAETLDPVVHRLVGPAGGEMDKTHGLKLRAAMGTGDAGDGHADSVVADRPGGRLRFRGSVGSEPDAVRRND